MNAVKNDSLDTQFAHFPQGVLSQERVLCMEISRTMYTINTPTKPIIIQIKYDDLFTEPEERSNDTKSATQNVATQNKSGLDKLDESTRFKYR